MAKPVQVDRLGFGLLRPEWANPLGIWIVGEPGEILGLSEPIRGTLAHRNWTPDPPGKHGFTQ